MDTFCARQIAERVHANDREADGTPRLAHIGRVVAATPAEMQSVAWLHEVLESGAISEQELLLAGLEADELRALRLLRAPWSESEVVQRAHVELVAQAAGPSGVMARAVAVADLSDRCAQAGGALPQSARALRRLLAVRDVTENGRTLSAGA